VTVTATRTTNLQPDQVVFEVDVTGPITSARDQALAALEGTGITAANSTGVRTAQTYSGAQNQPQTQLVWSFTLAADLASMKDSAGMLSAAQQRVAARNNGFSISFYVQGTQVSPHLAQTQQCVISDLIADARGQAQKLAAAAGVSLGSILSMSSATSTTAAGFGSVISTPACTLTVRFSLGAF
jgi:hypothetical protein